MQVGWISLSKCQPVWSNAAFGNLFLPLIALWGRRYSCRQVLSSSVWPPSAASLRTLPSYKTTLGACQFEKAVWNNVVCLYSAPNDVICRDPAAPGTPLWRIPFVSTSHLYLWSRNFSWHVQQYLIHLFSQKQTELIFLLISPNQNPSSLTFPPRYFFTFMQMFWYLHYH